MMVLDRNDTNTAMKELNRHYNTCQTYAQQHRGTCFLVNLAIMPEATLTGSKAVKVWVSGNAILCRHCTTFVFKGSDSLLVIV